MVDAGFLRQDHGLESAYPDFEDNTVDLRSAQLQVLGSFGPHVLFKAQFEGAGTTSTGFKDAYVLLRHLPIVSNIRIGQGKEPISPESLTSFKYVTFMERSLSGDPEFDTSGGADAAVRLTGLPVDRSAG